MILGTEVQNQGGEWSLSLLGLSGGSFCLSQLPGAAGVPRPPSVPRLSQRLPWFPCVPPLPALLTRTHRGPTWLTQGDFASGL